jgi:hypothetical protein
MSMLYPVIEYTMQCVRAPVFSVARLSEMYDAYLMKFQFNVKNGVYWCVTCDMSAIAVWCYLHSCTLAALLFNNYLMNKGSKKNPIA